MAKNDFLEVEIFGDRALVRNLEQMPAIVRVLLVEKARSWINAIEDRVRDNINSRLGEKTGKLSAALDSKVYEEDGMVRARVFFNDPKVEKYAKALEKGAVIPPHIIRPREGKILAFYAATGDKVFATQVFHPGAVIAGRHFMRDASRVGAAQLSRDIKNTVVQGIRRSMRGEV